MYNKHHPIPKQAKRHIAGFAIVKGLVRYRDRLTSKDGWRISKIDAMLVELDIPGGPRMISIHLTASARSTC